MGRKIRVEQIDEVGFNPGVSEDGGSLTWDNSLKKYKHEKKAAVDHTHDTSEFPLYSTSSPTTNEIGDIPAGTEYTDEPIVDILDKILHKYQKPTILSFTTSQ